MAKWDKKYFVTELKPYPTEVPWAPKPYGPDEAQRLISLDGGVIKGAFYMETAWFWPGKWPEKKGEESTTKEHSHQFDEAVAFIGTDPKNPYDLCGEVELWIDGKRNVLDKSFIAFVPAGIRHCPLIIRKVNKPIFHFTAGMSTDYEARSKKA